MDEEKRQAMALFRYGLIAPLVAETYPQTSKEAYYRDVSSKEYTLPNGDTTTFNATTIKKWFIQYKKYGLEGITPSTRIDAGRSRKLEESVIDKIREYRTLMPYITARKIYDRLIEEGHINYTEVSIDTIYRYLRTNSALTIAKPKEECLSFECLYAGDCWQAESSHGPTIIVDGKKVTTWLISFIDDASRLITHGEFLNRKLDNLKQIQERITTLFRDQRVTPVFWIDEAQYLNQHILADLKLLMNFEMDSRNYAIMILSGLPSINSTLSMRIHEALHQRIVMNYCFQGLSEEETKNYLETRLRLCGTKTDIFTPSAMIAMSNYSNGSIRKLDNVIHKALMIGCSKEGKVIDNELILEAINESELL